MPPPRHARRSAGLPRRVWDALVFQGGGALGAYEWGAYEALAEHGFDFDVVAGVSIGAANAAIVASRGRDAPTYLARFWEALSDPMAELPAGDPTLRRQVSAWKSVYLGNPAMFTPRWVSEPWNLGAFLEWTSLYDPTPYRRLLDQSIDFQALKHPTTRLLVTAVDIQSGQLVAFDSDEIPITRDHILASGALPPAFPPIRIGERHYWDGGLVSNTPSRRVLHALPPEDQRRLVLIELFPSKHRIPRNLLEVLATMKDLTYMDKLNLDTDHSKADAEVHEAMERALSTLSPAERERVMAMPEYIALFRSHRHHVELYLLTHTAEQGELDSKDYDFSPSSLRHHRREGRKAADAAILRWQKEPHWAPFGRHRPRGAPAAAPATPAP